MLYLTTTLLVVVTGFSSRQQAVVTRWGMVFGQDEGHQIRALCMFFYIYILCRGFSYWLFLGIWWVSSSWTSPLAPSRRLSWHFIPKTANSINEFSIKSLIELAILCWLVKIKIDWINCWRGRYVRNLILSQLRPGSGENLP